MRLRAIRVRRAKVEGQHLEEIVKPMSRAIFSLRLRRDMRAMACRETCRDAWLSRSLVRTQSTTCRTAAAPDVEPEGRAEWRSRVGRDPVRFLPSGDFDARFTSTEPPACDGVTDRSARRAEHGVKDDVDPVVEDGLWRMGCVGQ